MGHWDVAIQWRYSLPSVFMGSIFLDSTWCWSWNSNILATSCKELTHWKRPWCWEGLGTGGEGDDRRWDSWMASLTQWAWVWVNSGSWSWTGRPGCDSWGLKESDTTVRLNWTELTVWPTIDWKFFQKKIPKRKPWMWSTPATIYIAFTLYLQLLT